jgi:hypothetical protein
MSPSPIGRRPIGMTRRRGRGNKWASISAASPRSRGRLQAPLNSTLPNTPKPTLPNSPTPPRRVEITHAFASSSSNSTTQRTRQSNREHGARARGDLRWLPRWLRLQCRHLRILGTTRPFAWRPSRRLLAPCLRLNTARHLVHVSYWLAWGWGL